MLPKRSGCRPAALTFILALGVSIAAGPPAAAARPAEGGINSRTHKSPPATAVKCRICARKRCTVVSVRGKRCTRRRALAALEARIRQRPGRPQKAIPQPQLDDRSYKQLEKETRRRIPRHTPEWKNLNDSDPGVAILETARRNPRSVRVQRVPSAALPEPDDEVMVDFEHGDPD